MSEDTADLRSETDALRAEVARLRAVVEAGPQSLRESESALRESEARFRAAVGAVGILWTNDADGRMVGPQPGWSSLTGQSPEECEGYGWAAAVHPEDAQPTIDAWNEAVRERRTFEFEHRVRDREGRWRRFSIRAVPVLGPEGSVREWVGVHADVTDLREAVEALRRSEAELDRKVRERTAELQAANETLNGFTYYVAHDLRAPLRSIVSTSRIVQEDFGDALPAEALALLDRQAQAALRLGQLIDDLLRLSRLSQLAPERSRVDLTALAREVAAEALGVHPGSTARVVVDEGLVTRADPSLLRLALGNLIENAVKYSPDGGAVTVGARAGKAFFVSDEGIGIDPRYFTKVFEPFQRLHKDEEFAGTGIGLSNVRQIVERHGGRVWVESSPGAGSTFLFTLGE